MLNTESYKIFMAEMSHEFAIERVDRISMVETPPWWNPIGRWWLSFRKWYFWRDMLVKRERYLRLKLNSDE